MLISLNRRSLLTFYLTIIRPCFTLTYSNMSGITEADKYSIVYVTVPRMEEGRNLGRMVVENKLAACVNIIPQITSIYEWKGKMTEDSELLMMIKTRTSEVDRLAEFMRTHHPYEVCEVIAVPIQNGNLPYLNWIGQQVTQNKKA